MIFVMQKNLAVSNICQHCLFWGINITLSLRKEQKLNLPDETVEPLNQSTNLGGKLDIVIFNIVFAMVSL